MLSDLLRTAIDSPDKTFALSESHRNNLAVIIDNACAGKQKAALAVILTLLLKKYQEPKQNIRLHMAGMEGGFSGRGMDSTTVTPFLAKENFPFMQAGSGWLTRSFEQNHPYDQEYTGNIRPHPLRSAFLDTVDQIESGVNVESSILFVLRQLHEWRTANASLTLARPTGKRIVEIMQLVSKHWDSNIKGVSKLPVLAVYAAYECLINEVARYKCYTLDPMRSHTSPDSRDNCLGDVQISDEHGKPFEAVEVKHKIPITCDLLNGLREKISGAGVKCFYVLSTDEKIAPDQMENVSKFLLQVRQSYGCQVIVNGVGSTLKYYLRLMKNVDNFVDKYVSLVEQDTEIPFELKRCWNEIVDSETKGDT